MHIPIPRFVVWKIWQEHASSFIVKVRYPRQNFMMTSQTTIQWGMSPWSHGSLRATVLAPWHVVKSLQLIWRLVTRRFPLRVSDLQMSRSELKTRRRDSNPINITIATGPISPHHLKTKQFSVFFHWYRPYIPLIYYPMRVQFNCSPLYTRHICI